jgi:hypothetical protein
MVFLWSLCVGSWQFLKHQGHHLRKQCVVDTRKLPLPSKRLKSCDRRDHGRGADPLSHGRSALRPKDEQTAGPDLAFRSRRVITHAEPADPAPRFTLPRATRGNKVLAMGFKELRFFAFEYAGEETFTPPSQTGRRAGRAVPRVFRRMLRADSIMVTIFHGTVFPPVMRRAGDRRGV